MNKFIKLATYINFFWWGFVAIISLIMLFTGNPQAGLYLIFIGAIFLHGRIVFEYTRNIEYGSAVRSNSPKALFILSLVMALFATILIIGAVVIIGDTNAIYEVVKLQLSVPKEDVIKSIKGASFIMLFFAINTIIQLAGGFYLLIQANKISNT